MAVSYTHLDVYKRQEYAQQVLNSGKTSGYLKNFRYLVTESETTGPMIIFLDRQVQLRSDVYKRQEQITVLPTNDDATIVAELAKYSCPNIYLITWLYKYKSLEKYLIEHEGEKDSTPSTAV